MYIMYSPHVLACIPRIYAKTQCLSMFCLDIVFDAHSSRHKIENNHASLSTNCIPLKAVLHTPNKKIQVFLSSYSCAPL